MPSWDDQFDFDDVQDKKKKAKPINKNNQKKANNYDDEFFDDQPQPTSKQTTPILPTINSRNSAKSKPTIQQPTTKPNPYANKSFGSHNNQYDDEQIVDEQQLIVPKSNKSQLKTEKSVQKLVKSKSSIADQYTEELVEDEEEFHQSIKHVQSGKLGIGKGDKSKTEGKQANKQYENKTKHVQQEEEDDDYGEEFEENEEYGEDQFQEDVKSPIKTNNKQEGVKQQKTTHKQDVNPSLKTNNLTVAAEQNKPAKQQLIKPPISKPPVPSDKKSPKNEPSTSSNRNINKLSSQSVSKPIKRSISRQSARSDAKDSVQASRITTRNQSQYFPNKHSDMVAKSFPHDQQQLSTTITQQQVSKLNQKMRGMIRKFNEQLNELINKNMLLLKNKGNDNKQQYNVDDKIRQLQIQKKSGQTAIDVMQKDFEKLHGRAGELNEEEYQLILEKQVEQLKVQIKQATKYITTVKRDVDTRGKKLSVKEVEQRNAQSVHHLKTILIQTRKDEEKSDQRIQKLVVTQEELETKLADIDYRLDEVIAEAKEKGISVEGNVGMIKRFEELKIKLQNGRNYNKKTEGLVTTKVDILNHENEQIKITIKNVSSQVQNVYGSIQHSQGQAIKLIQRAKQRGGISPGFVESLDKLLRQLEEARVNNSGDYNDARSEVKSRRSESTKTGKGGKGNGESIEKSLPLRTTQSQNRLLDMEGGGAKPNFGKKKLGEVQERHEHHVKLENQNDKNKSQLPQRVWKDEDNNDEKKGINQAQHNEKRRSVEQLAKKQIQIQEEKKDKSKPFMLKKNKPAENKEEFKEKSFDNNPVVMNIPEKVINNQTIPTKDEPKKQQPNVILAPKMMRFGRKKNDDGVVGSNDVSNDNVQQGQKVIDSKQQSPKVNPVVVERKDVGVKLEISEPVKPEVPEENAVFVPKRFNLRNKAEKKDDSYMPSVQRDTSSVTTSANVQQVQSPIQKQQPLIKQEYKPKFDFKSQEFKPATVVKQEIILKKQVEKPVEQTEVKPRFNLRLRDRVNKNLEDDDGYVANIGEKVKLDGGLGEGKKEVKVEAKMNIGGNEFMANKVGDKQPITNVYNPYAPKIEPSTQHQQAKKIEPPTKFTPPQKTIIQPPLNPVSNPYAVKFQPTTENQPTITQPVKRQRGPLKKNKPTNIPKENFNIYAQADDITSEVKEIGGIKTANQAVFQVGNVGNKKEELNLNEMLGIKKEVKKNDFDDLLGDVGVGNAKSKKKNNDFFSDMQF